MLTVTSKMTILAREVRGYVTVSRDMRGKPEQRSGVSFDGSNVVLF